MTHGRREREVREWWRNTAHCVEDEKITAPLFTTVGDVQKVILKMYFPGQTPLRGSKVSRILLLAQWYSEF